MAAALIVNLATSSDCRFRDIVGRDQYQVATTGNLTRKIYHHLSGNEVNVSVVEAVSVSNNNAQFDLLLSTSTAPLVLADITTNNLATWSANSILTLRQDTTTIRSANVAVGNLNASTISTNLPSFPIVGEARLDNCIVRSFLKTLGATAGDASDICTLQNINEAYTVELNVTQSESSATVAKTYLFAVRSNATADAWQRLIPITSTLSTNWGVEIRVNTTTATLRLVRVSGSTTTNLECTLTVFQSQADPVVISASATANTGVTFASTLYENTLVTQVRGNVGIGTDNPTALLTVAGTASVNSLVATNGVVGSSVGALGQILDSTVLLQGAYMSWNHSGFDGHTDFVCKRGLGYGGFQFFLSNGHKTEFSDGKTLLATIDENGITMPQGIYSAPGSIVGSLVLTNYNSALNGGVTISPTSLNRTTYNTTWQAVATFNYTPKSTSSRISIHFDIDYLVEGGNQDTLQSLVTLGGLQLAYKQQRFGTQAAVGTGTRSNVIFPISGTIANTVLTPHAIVIYVNMGSTDDTLLLSPNNWTFELLEIQT